MDDEVTGTAVL